VEFWVWWVLKSKIFGQESTYQKQKKQREPAEDMSPLDLLREVLRWRNLKKLNKQKKPSEPGDDPEGRQ
jgi:hypothetical protein